MPQTATSGNLADAQRIIIEAARYTQEHNAPSWQLVEKFTLPKGAKQITVPKVGQFTISDLVDGQDMVDEQEIGMTTVDLTTGEVGAKIICTDKLVRQNGTTPIFQMVGRQFGAAAARKQDKDVQALYTNLNGGTNYGLASKELDAATAAAIIAKGRSKTSDPFFADYVVHHPSAIFNLSTSLNIIGSSTTHAPDSVQLSTIADFWAVKLNGVNFYESANISVDASDDAIGVIAQTDALCAITSVGFRTERERDASRRAWELNHVADYGVAELDDTKGAGVIYDAATPTDST